MRCGRKCGRDATINFALFLLMGNISLFPAMFVDHASFLLFFKKNLIYWMALFDLFHKMIKLKITPHIGFE